jgi:hypothetical protein
MVFREVVQECDADSIHATPRYELLFLVGLPECKLWVSNHHRSALMKRGSASSNTALCISTVLVQRVMNCISEDCGGKS